MRSAEKKSTTIFLPDMFKTFLKNEPQINPFYAEVKAQSEEWLKRFCNFCPTMEMRITKCDFSYFCSIAAPNASRDELRTVCDWGNWVFPYDDMFDCGELKNQPDAAERVMESLMESMWGSARTTDKLKIVQAHDTVVMRLAKTCSLGVQSRFANAMRAYCIGALNHVEDEFASRTPTLEEMISIRRRSAGVSPLYHLVEYAHHIRLPDFVFHHPVIRELQSLGIDMVSISNDIISYRKERVDGVKHNMVVICEAHGMSTQGAFNSVGASLQECYNRWDQLEQRLPQWTESINRELVRYIDGIKNVVKANLYWSFRSGRYFGEDTELVRKTHTIKIPSA